MKLGARIEFTGIKPILINTFPLDTFNTNKTKSGSIGKNETEWKNTVLMDKERNLYMLSSYIVGSIRDGGKHIKVGKATLSKKVSSCLECLENEIFFGLKVPEEKNITNLTTDDVYIDIRSVVNPATKGRNLRYRIAAKAGWKINCTIFWDDFALSREQMKNCIENAGLFEGIGDGRRIGFGRFKLTKFEILDL